MEDHQNAKYSFFSSPQYHHLFNQQCKIGWDQILHGRFSSQRSMTTDPMCANSAIWLSSTISQSWQFVLKYGLFDVINTMAQISCRKQMFKQQPNAKDTELYQFKHSMSQILLQPIPHFEQWIYKVCLQLKTAAQIK
jgi:hypothetical protein